MHCFTICGHSCDTIRRSKRKTNIVLHALSEPRSAHRILLLIGGLIAITIAAYWPTSIALWHHWVLVPSLGGMARLLPLWRSGLWLSTRRPLPALSDVPPRIRAGARPYSMPGYLAAAVALIAAPILVCLVAPFAAHSAAASGLRLPPGRADWQGPFKTPDDAWRPQFVGDHEERRVA